MIQVPEGFEGLDEELFRCVKCEKNLREPVWMCREGHNVCDSCKSNDTCSKCGESGMILSM